MISVALFTNLKSGRNRRDKRRLKKFSSIIGDCGNLYVTGRSSDFLADLENKVMQACEDKLDIIAIDGGDGTMSTVLSLLEQHWDSGELPPIAPLNGGTFNILSRRLKVKDSFKYLNTIVESEEVNNLIVKGIKMMRVSDDSGHKHLSFSSGVGFPVDLLEEAYKKKHLKYFRIGLMAIKALGSAIVGGKYYQQFNKRRKMLVTGEGHAGEISIEENWLGIMAQSIDSLGIPKYLPQPKIFRNAETDGRFHGVGVAMDFRKFLIYFPAIYTGESVHYKDRESEEIKPVLALDKQLKSLKIQSEEAFKYHFSGELEFDGQPCLTRELNIDAGKNVYFIEK